MIQFLSTLWVALRVTLRRLVKGPKRATWSWKYECFITLLKNYFRKSVRGREATARREIDRIGEQLLRPGIATFQDVEISNVGARWALPANGAPAGIVIYLHGGGYVVGSVRSHCSMLAELSQRAQVKVLGIDYRLAPEHRCPAPIEDVIQAYRWLLDQGESPGGIVLAGDSAGGGLAVAAMVAMREQSLPLPAGAMLISPWTDLTMSETPPAERADTDFVRASEMRMMGGDEYYAGELSTRDPRVSPMFADLRGLPPLLIFTGECEILSDDCRRFAERAREHGCDAHLVIGRDEVHTYAMFLGLSAAAEPAMEKMIAFIRNHVA